MIVDPVSLRAAWAALCQERDLNPTHFGGRACALVDAHLAKTFKLHFESVESGGAALVALGSYGRRELCPQSDLDLVLVHERVHDLGKLADSLWYPLWDAGFVLGHGVRTVKEAMSLGDDDSDALFAMLDARHLAGNQALSRTLMDGARELARRRRGRLIEAIMSAAENRAALPVAELLEPDLKRGGGGLRDAQSLTYAGHVVGNPDGPGGIQAFVEQGYMRDDDARRASEAYETILVARVALHLVTGSRNDHLLLQEQDAVAARLGLENADALALGVAKAGRDISWIASDVYSRLRSTEAGPVWRVARRDKALADGVVARDGRAVLLADATADGDAALRFAVAAARHDLVPDRDSLARFAGCNEPTWTDPQARQLFTELLLYGRSARRAIEALDHVGAMAIILPEWERLRALSQRNAYHRYNVDRHLLETVFECVDLLSDTGFDGRVASDVDRPELLVLAALLHDAAKGLPGDHSEVGADLAGRVCRRIGLDSAGVTVVETVVRHHLLMADVATRRDLSEETTVARVAQALNDAPTLRIAYLLTIGDSLATGPAAWSHMKAELVRELYSKANGLLERGDITEDLFLRRRELRERMGDAADAYLDAMPPAYVRAFDADVMARHAALLSVEGPALEWSDGAGPTLGCTVACPDRTGLLGMVAGVLALFGYDVRSAWVFTREDGMALEVFSGVDRFDRLSERATRDEVIELLRDALAGQVDIAGLLEERSRRYAKPQTTAVPEVVVMITQDESDFATVLEVHAQDEPTLLHRVTAALAAASLDVHFAKVATLGDRVVDTFYLRDAAGGKVADTAVLNKLRADIEASLHATPLDRR